MATAFHTFDGDFDDALDDILIDARREKTGFARLNDMMLSDAVDLRGRDPADAIAQLSWRLDRLDQTFANFTAAPDAECYRGLQAADFTIAINTVHMWRGMLRQAVENMRAAA